MGCCTSICCCCRGGRCATWRDAGDPAAGAADLAVAEPDQASASAAAAAAEGAEARRHRAAAAFHPFGLTAEGQVRQPDNHEEWQASPRPAPSVNSIFEPTEPTAGAEPPSTAGSLNFLTFDDVATTTILEAESTADDTPHHYSDVSPCPSPSINHDLLVNDSFVSAASQQIHIPRLDVSSAQKAKQIRLYNRKITHVATLAAEAEAEADAKAAAAAATVAAVNEAASSTATTPVPAARRFPPCLLNLNNHLGFTTPSSAVYTSPAVSDSSSSSSTTSGPGESSCLSSTSSSLAVVGCLAYEETEPTPTTGGDRRQGGPPRGAPPPRPPHHHARSCSVDAAAAAATAAATATDAGTRPFHRRVFSEGCDGDFARGGVVPVPAPLLPPTAPFAARQEGPPLAEESPSPTSPLPQLNVESPASPPLLTRRIGAEASADFAERDGCRSSRSPFPEN